MKTIKIWFVIFTLVTVSSGSSQRKTSCKECDCGIPNIDIKIIGGQETKVNQYPWMTLLEKFNRFNCGGSLINDQYILTATHCTLKITDLSNLKVKLMVHQRSKPNETEVIVRRISKIIKHPDYGTSVNYNNDISLLKMDKKVELVGKLRPVCLPEKDNQFVNFIGIATGWGRLSENQQSAVLREVNVSIVTNEYCSKAFGNNNTITDSMICTIDNEEAKGPCTGDSGGPLHIQNQVTSKFEVAGVVSFGMGICPKPLYPVVYARVNSYLTWIKENTADACYCGSN